MRYMRVRMNGQFLVEIMSQGYSSSIKCIRGLPKGARFAYSIPDPIYGISLVVEHESFKLLKDGDEIPIFIDPTFKSKIIN